MRCVPSRKSITSIESKDHEKLVLAGARPLTKQATLMSLGKRGSGDKLREVVSNNFYINVHRVHENMRSPLLAS